MINQNRIAAAIAAGCAGLAVANAAAAVDLRDWGRKYNTAAERFVVLAQFNNEAVLDKETQLVWERSPYTNVWDGTVTWTCGNRKVGGRMGWRVPTLAELTSLVAPSASGGMALQPGHPFVIGQGNFAISKRFWTVSVYRLLPEGGYDRRMMVDFDWQSGRTEPVYEEEPNILTARFWCVRGAGETPN